MSHTEEIDGSLSIATIPRGSPGTAPVDDTDITPEEGDGASTVAFSHQQSEPRASPETGHLQQEHSNQPDNSTYKRSNSDTPDTEKEGIFDTTGVALLTPTKGSNGREKAKSKPARGGRTRADSTLKSARMTTSVEDITSLRLWKGIVAEFMGTLLLTLIGCGSCIDLNPARGIPGEFLKPTPVVQIALCFGLSVATIVWAIGHVSGGHINPAVTAAMLATRKISLAKGAFFVLFQLIGSVVGAGILYGLTPDAYHGSLGATTVNDKLSSVQGAGVELLITFVLVFTVFASCDGRRKDLKGSAALTIGLSVTMCHLFAIQFTGSSMNTARSFGPALVMGIWTCHWVYWVGPIIGGVLAGLLYDNLFAVNASLAKAKACILSSDYDDEKYRAHKMKVRIIEEDEPEDEVDDDDLALTSRAKMDGSNLSRA